VQCCVCQASYETQGKWQSAMPSCSSSPHPSIAASLLPASPSQCHHPCSGSTTPSLPRFLPSLSSIGVLPFRCAPSIFLPFFFFFTTHLLPSLLSPPYCVRGSGLLILLLLVLLSLSSFIAILCCAMMFIHSQPRPSCWMDAIERPVKQCCVQRVGVGVGVGTYSVRAHAHAHDQSSPATAPNHTSRSHPLILPLSPHIRATSCPANVTLSIARPRSLIFFFSPRSRIIQPFPLHLHPPPQICLSLA